jgi:hypothetical protein
MFSVKLFSKWEYFDGILDTLYKELMLALHRHHLTLIICYIEGLPYE